MPKHKKQQTLTKSKLIESLLDRQPLLEDTDIELAVKSILDRMSNALVEGRRIEIRGFGSMCLHHRPARLSRNPKTGEPVYVPEKFVPHFKPGKELKARVNSKKQS